MKKQTGKRPTAAQLSILNALWHLGPSTVRQVHEYLTDRQASKQGYTTILKLMQIMNDEGLLTRELHGRSHRYRPGQSQNRTQGSIVGDLIDRAFSGSTSDLVVRALSSRPVSKSEMDEIRRFLDQQERIERES